MILAVIRQRLREGRRPPRDVVLTFLADEEAGGVWGARYLADNHRDLFEGVTEAIGEVGGFSATLGGQRLYLLQTAEKGMAWLRLTPARPGRARVHEGLAQRGHRTGRDGRQDRPARVAAPADPGGAGSSSRPPPRRSGIERGRGCAAGAGEARPAGPDDRRDGVQHLESHRAERGLQGERHPRPGDGRGGLPVRARVRRRAPGRDRRPARARRPARVHPP